MLETAGGVVLGLIGFWLFLGLIAHILEGDKTDFVKAIPISMVMGPIRFFV
jgi:hypothetical protein